MNRRKLLLAGAALALPLRLHARPASPFPAPEWIAAARGVLERWIGGRVVEFELLPLHGEPGQDAFEYSARGGTVRIHGTSTVALARGAYEYLRRHGGRQRAWSADASALPRRFPDAATTRGASPFSMRQYFNVCTFGYTTVWWDWARWERELDWMALHGINMPLAMTGQEAIWTRVWESFGLARTDLDGFFTGPAFLPWQRMGNVNRHGGPLGDAWMAEQVQLQHRILARARELGMQPIVPGFSGFVPPAYHGLHPDARIATNSNWAHFPDDHRTRTLSPADPRFVEIGASYIREYEREYGRCEYYLADTFNELDPPVSTEHRYDELAAYGNAVYRSIHAGNPDATWVMQGWLFHDHKEFWDGPSARALLRDVPDDRMIVLDLSNELFHGWEEHAQFYGKRWIYSVIHSFGGNTPWHGDLALYATDAARTLAACPGKHLAGYGMAPEGIENNEVVYELMTDAAWSRAPIDAETWLEQYQVARYGVATPATRRAWALLREDVFSKTIFLCKHAFQGRPSAKLVGDVPASQHLAEALELLLAAAPSLLAEPLYRNDLVDVASRRAGIAIDQLLATAIAAHAAGDGDGRERAGRAALELMEDLDALLATRADLRLERWIAAARAWGRDEAERDLYERNARLQVTTWGGPDLFDYASKLWSGLVRDFYQLRWAAYFGLLRAGRTEAQIEQDLAQVDDFWTRRKVLSRERIAPDVPTAIRALLRRIGGGPAAAIG